MGSNNISDIDPLIRELEHLRLNLNDPVMGSGFWDMAVKDFINRHSTKIITLLEELEKTRGHILIRPEGTRAHTVVVEGRAETDPLAALSAALDKALLYSSANHDLILVLKEIGTMSQDGFHAKIELHVIRRGSNSTPDEKLAGLKHIHAHDYGCKTGRHHGNYPVFNHFAGAFDDGDSELPEYILVNVPDAASMNYMINQRFFHQGRQPWPGPGQPFPDKMIVRVRRPHMVVRD